MREVGFGKDAPASQAAAPAEPGWEAYLDQGERLLWTGAPETGLKLRKTDLFLIPFSLFWSGGVVAWVAIALSMGAPWYFVLFGLPFLVVAAFLLIGRFFLDSYQRAHTRYALTDRRAIIARSAFGRSLRSKPLAADTPMLLELDPGAVRFGAAAELDYDGDGDEHLRWRRNRRRRRRARNRMSFEFISAAAAEEVYRLARRVVAEGLKPS